MTRIIAGEFGGRQIAVPSGGRTRPTSDRVREALFSRLEHEIDLDGASVLDLYAGSGALGLEALSRGAEHATLVESAAPASKVITRNAATLGAQGRVVVRTAAVSTFLAGGASGPFEVVLLDPPYDVDDIWLGADLRALVTGAWLAEGALVVVERSTRSGEPAWPPGLTRFAQRRYGETTLWWAEADTGDAVA